MGVDKVGTTRLLVGGYVVAVRRVSDDHATGKARTEVTSDDPQDNSRHDVPKSTKVTIEVAIPKDGNEPDWDHIDGAQIEQMDPSGVWRNAWDDFWAENVSAEYPINGEATRTITGYAKRAYRS